MEYKIKAHSIKQILSDVKQKLDILESGDSLVVKNLSIKSTNKILSELSDTPIDISEDWDGSELDWSGEDFDYNGKCINSWGSAYSGFIVFMVCENS